MSRLPQLERALFDAAARQEREGAARDRATRRRRHLGPLLVGLASLVVAGGAVGAVSGLLDTGDPVPDAPRAPWRSVEKAHGITLAGVRAADPAGGPDWGIATYDAVPTAAPPGHVPSGIAAQLKQPVTCVLVGRVQAGRLGVIGRDGVFDDDGRFHPLSPDAQVSTACGGRTPDGAFINFASVPPIPASGYTGPPGTAIGGCRERVDLDGPTVSPQTRLKLAGVPQCATASLRHVVAGFAGPHAATATVTAPGYRKTLELDPADSGAFLFVLRATSAAQPRLVIKARNGRSCEPFYRNPLQGDKDAVVPRRSCAHLDR